MPGSTVAGDLSQYENLATRYTLFVDGKTAHEAAEYAKRWDSP